MDILESLEVRWFLPPGGSVGSDLKTWFGSTEAEGERTDHYLATGRYDLNFKARLEKDKPEKVETKYLAGSLGVVDLATKISGEARALELEAAEAAFRKSVVEPSLEYFAEQMERARRGELPLAKN